MPTSSQAVTQISDDEVFRRKLLMDGEGMGEDRRLNILLKTFLKWLDGKEDAEEDFSLGYERLLTTLANCEFSMAKSQLVQEVNQVEVKNYDELYGQIESDIAQAQQNIVDRKADLQQSKRVRKNKQQYDALAKIIALQPDRKVTMSKLQQLGDEIRALEKTKVELQLKQEKRHKQFQVLLGAAHELQQIVKEDSESTEMEVD